MVWSHQSTAYTRFNPHSWNVACQSGGESSMVLFLKYHERFVKIWNKYGDVDSIWTVFCFCDQINARPLLWEQAQWNNFLCSETSSVPSIWNQTQFFLSQKNIFISLLFCPNQYVGLVEIQRATFCVCVLMSFCFQSYLKWHELY